MSKVYQSVRGVVQGTLHRPKPQIMVSAATKGNEGSLNDAIEQLEKIFVDGLGRLKAAASDDQVVAIAAQHAEQVIEGLKANITVLEARLRETEDTLDKKDVASQNMEESLSTEIGDLQSTLKKKEEDLENRVSEVNDLKSKTDVLVEQVTQSELALQQAKREAAIAAQYAGQLIEGVSRQTSPCLRLGLGRPRMPSINKTLPANKWKKVLALRSAIYRVHSRRKKKIWKLGNPK